MYLECLKNPQSPQVNLLIYNLATCPEINLFFYNLATGCVFILSTLIRTGTFFILKFMIKLRY